MSVELLFRITADGSQAVREISGVRSAVQSRTQQIASDFQAAGARMQATGAKMTAAITLPLTALAAISTRSTISLDSVRNKLMAVEGSAEAAAKRFKQLNDLADNSVGVMRRTAAESYAQLATIGGITEKTIERQIKAVGRLNAAFDIDDQQGFFRNLTQIFQQNFERGDIKEALGRVPIFEQLLESAFGTKDGDKLRALKESGKLTLDAFLSGLAGAVETDPRLANIGESVGVRLAKTVERVQYALEPLGRSILDAVEPYIPPLVSLIEKLSAAFESLPDSSRFAVVAFGLVAAAAGPIVFAVGTVITAIGTIIGLLSSIGAPVAIAVGAVVLVVTAIAAAYYSNFGGIRDFTKEVFEAIKSAVQAGLSFISDLWQKHGPEITGFAQKAWAGITSTLRTAAGLLVSVWRDNLQSIVQWTRENWPLIQRTIETVLRRIGAIVSEVLKQVRAFWAEHGETITTVARIAWTALTTIIGTALRNVLAVVKLVMQIINGEWSGAWDTFKGIVSRTATAIGNLYTLFLAAGLLLAKHIVDGIVNGIRDGAARVVEAGRWLANKATFGALDALEIKSPSRVFYRIGQNIVSGLVDALKDGRAAADSAMRSLVIPPSLRGLKLKPAQATRAAEIGAGDIEREAEGQRAAAQRDFEQFKTSDADYVRSLTTAAEREQNARLAVISARRAEANATIKNRVELAIKLEELRGQERELEASHKQAIQQINDAAAGRAKQAALAHEQALEEIARAREEREIQRLESLADEGWMRRSEAERKIQEIRDGALRRELEVLQKELEAHKANLLERQRITDEIAKLNDRRAASAEDASRRIIAAQGSETTLPEPSGLKDILNKRPEEKAPIQNPDDPEFGPPPDFSAHISVIGAFKTFAMDAFSGIAQGFGGMIQAFLNGGQLSGKAFLSMAKAVAAGLAAQSLVEAAMQVAHAIKEKALAAASLAVGDVGGAALHTVAAAAHLKAAAAFGIVGGVAAAAALAIPGGGGAGALASGGAGGSGGQDEGARYREFNYGGGGFSSSAVAGDGSRNTGGIGGMVRETVDEVRAESAKRDADSARREAAMRETLYGVADAMRPFTTASPEAIVQRGLDSSTGAQAAGDAVLRHQRASHEFTMEFLRSARIE
jgi:phage-related protein